MFNETHFKSLYMNKTKILILMSFIRPFNCPETNTCILKKRQKSKDILLKNYSDSPVPKLSSSHIHINILKFVITLHKLNDNPCPS